MILITLGTQDKSFHRLLEEVDCLIKKGVIKDKVIVQAGSTKYKSSNMEIFDLIDPDTFNYLIKKARFVITHAGVGTILNSILAGKKVIAAARLKKYKEHVNDHQLEIVRAFSKDKYIIGVEDVSGLEKAIKKLKTFKPAKYEETRDDLVNYIDNYIESL